MKEILRNVSMVRMLALMKMTQKAQELYHRSELYWSLHLWLDAHRLRNILQVLKKKDVLAAAQKELNSFKQKNVFEEVDPSELPKGRTVIPMK